MTITASLVKELRERTGVGMMECKKVLVEVNGDLDSAQELLRTRGQATADKKAGRIAADGRVEIATGASGAIIVEVNCETDFVAKDDSFAAFSRQVAQQAVDHQPGDLAALMALPSEAGETLEDARQTLIARIGENISVRRFQFISPTGLLGRYLHGDRIAVLVDVEGGDDDLRKDLAMHIAASGPQCVSPDEVPAATLEKERQILTERAAQEGKPAEIVQKMVEGRLRKYLGEITLLGQPFVKDPDITVGKLLQQKKATVHAFVRMEVGEGIEKKSENFAAEVQAQIEAQS
jgi:elongation factor Ts